MQNQLNIGILKGWHADMSKIAGGWNGEDSSFIVEDVKYTEDDATAASEALKHIERLEHNFEFLRY